jgi:hypothetical protein
MKSKLSVLLPLAAACAAAMSSASATEAGPRQPFHAARSVPEKALDAIIRRSDKDDNMFNYVLKRPGYDATKDAGYSRLFTPNLLLAWAHAEAELVKQDCGGKYLEGEICGFDYSPITCAQDSSDSGRVYRTIEATDDAVRIAYRWGGRGAPAEGPRYRLIKDGRDWKLDGVDCGDGVTFNLN